MGTFGVYATNCARRNSAAGIYVCIHRANRLEEVAKGGFYDNESSAKVARWAKFIYGESRTVVCARLRSCGRTLNFRGITL